MIKYLQILLCIYFCINVCWCDHGPEVEILTGKLQGKLMKTRTGREFNGFLGIPFAKPPIGNLRFAEPVEADSWTGIRNATVDAPICVQKNLFIKNPVVEGEEDCLYLNVYTPQLPKIDNELLPVMVFIHGGGFICGAGTSFFYGPDMLLDRDVVLVAMNYRLGPIGFLSTQDSVVPGNMGLKDQTLALKWVNKNIAKFGGNPNQVTIFGESAGGASVHYQMLTPLSKGLIHGAIAQSGTAIAPWAFGDENELRGNTNKLAKSLDCPTDSTEQLIECLRKFDAATIVDKDVIFSKWEGDLVIAFKPTKELHYPGAFITEHPINLIKKGKTHPVPWITGINSNEGALHIAGLVGDPHLLDEFSKNFDKMLLSSLMFKESSPNLDFVLKSIKQFYFKDKTVGIDTIQELIDLYTDAWFFDSAHEAVKLHLKYVKTPVYYYYFDYRGAASYSMIFGPPEIDFGVCHADELQYLFPVSDMLFPHIKPTESDKAITKLLTKLWVNFAKTGNPNLETNEIITTTWNQITEDKSEWLHIKNAEIIKMSDDLLHERAKFWQTLPITASEIARDEL